MGDMIRSAYDPEQGQKVHIDGTTPGRRYNGIPGTYHQDCLLYPRFPERRRASFVHLPGEAYCPEGRGESSEHKEAKHNWVEFIEDQLSGCAICMRVGRDTSPGHLCPVVYVACEVVAGIPSCYGILWMCESCNHAHLYELLNNASSVKCEWRAPGRNARVDIVLLDAEGEPNTLIEIKRRHLSDRPFRYATAHGIPLFVVDVSLGQNSQARLHDNRQQEEFVRMPDFSISPPRRFDFMRYSLRGTELVCGTDDQGRIGWRISYADPNEGGYRIPYPSIGPFILATKTTVSCEEIRDEMLSSTFIPGRDSFDETVDWWDRELAI